MSVVVTKRRFGRLPDGSAVELFTLRNSRGTEVSVSSWGAIITSVRTADRWGGTAEITLAHDTLDEYLRGHPYYGALIGRVCNRISGGGFQLDERRYELATNQGEIHLHGGNRGFDKQLYAGEIIHDGSTSRVRLTRVSPDGEEGYPGELLVAHTVGLSDEDCLTFTFEADTDAPTIVNMTNHCYWNLSGESSVLDHELQSDAAGVAERDERGVPTGRFLPVPGSPFDFSEWRRIRPGFESLLTQGVNGYDHSLAARTAQVRSAASGRMMTVSTTYPCVHFYSGNNLPGSIGRDGKPLTGQEALCLECQYFPDAPNRPEFPSIVLRPGTHYHHVTEHRFTTYS